MNATTSLSDMIKEQSETIVREESLDLPDPDETISIPTVGQSLDPLIESISITSLYKWFEENSSCFRNISQVKVAIRGIDASKTLIISVENGEGEIEGNPSRDLQVFKNADTQPVLNLKPTDMQIYNNGFKIIYPYEEQLAIKCYGVRTGLVCVFCNVINGELIPYDVEKVKKKDTSIQVVRNFPDEIIQKLTQPADLEALKLLYKQSSKTTDEMSTNSSAISWLLTRQKEVTDINHHLQIDNVIISLLGL